MNLKTLHKTMLTALLLVTTVISGMGQTTLAAGDIAIIRMNADAPDAFSFVTLVDIQAGTEIRFTDSGVLANGTFRGGEGAVKYTAPTSVSAGTIISCDVSVLTALSPNFTRDDDATVGTNGMNFSASGDQLVAFQGASTTPIFIFAINMDGDWAAEASSSNNSAVPTGLTNGTTAIAIIPEVDNAVYNMSVSTGTRAQLLTVICTIANWTTNDATTQAVPSGSFTVGADLTPPAATFAPTTGTADIALNSPITITFDEAIRNVVDNTPIADPTSLITLNETDAAGAAVAFTAVIDAAKKVITINPTNQKFNQVYFVAIAPVEDASDNATTEKTSTYTTIAAKTGKAITAFSFAEKTGDATFGDGTIAIEVASSATVTNLIATFTVSDGANVKVGAVDQVSATTPNDFTSPVTYTVTAEDGSTKDWVVTVTKAVTLSDATDITGFTLAEQTANATIDAVNHTIAIEVAPQTIVTALVPTITLSVGATVNPTSNTAQDFTNAVTYTVTAENTVATQVWTVTVTVAPTPAPLFTTNYPKAANVGSDKFDVVVNANAIGKAYFLNLPSGAAVPTSAEVKAGTPIDIAAAATDYTATITGLTKNTAYDVYFVTQSNDANSLLMATPVKLSVTTTAGAVTIHDIQYTADPSGDSPVKDQVVTTSGIVTAIKTGTDGQSSFYIQDGVGEWNAILVYVKAPVVALGDKVTVTGKVIEFYKLTEFDATSVVTIDSKNNALPNASTITTTEANTEQWESVLIKVENAAVKSGPDSYKEFVINNSTTDLQVDDKLFLATLEVGKNYSIVGVMDYSFDKFKLLPRDANDVVLLTGINNNDAVATKAYPNPFTGDFKINAGKVVRNITVSNMLGQKVMERAYNETEIEVPASDLRTGVYFVTVKFEDGTSSTLRMVKK